LSAYHIEHVSDALAQRHRDYRAGIDPDTLARFDDPTKRINYLILQDNLCDLPLSARRSLGKQFETTIQNVKGGAESKVINFTAAWADSKPDFVYVLASARRVSRPELIRRAEALYWER
jgi:hypothetical protein